jgi:hypothetical protein
VAAVVLLVAIQQKTALVAVAVVTTAARKAYQ